MTKRAMMAPCSAHDGRVSLMLASKSGRPRQTRLIAVDPSHPSLHGRDFDVPDVERLGILDENAGEESDEVLSVDDGVGSMRRHRNSNGLDELVLPELVALRDLGGHLTVGGLGLAEEKGLCERRKEEVSSRGRGDGTRSRNSLACSFLSFRSMTSWKPKTMMSGDSSEVRTAVRKPALSVVPVSWAGFDASMFQVHARTVSSL